MNEHCDRLDDFLAGDLPKDCRIEFKNHLHDCGACRGAIEDWQTICRLLTRATEQLERPDSALAERIDEHLTSVATREPAPARIAWIAALIAACLLFALIVGRGREHEDRIEERRTDIVAVTPPASKSFVPPANVILPDDVIGVPIDIGDPNVTVVWVYPTTTSRAVD